MIQYFDNQDNRPDAVSSAHWNDGSACSSDAPRLEAMYKLPIPHNLALAYLLQHKNSLPFSKYSLSTAIGRGNPQAHRRNITYQETGF
ncbi:MAG: hypothetical protein ACYDER_23625 [Ktedonobacteraceae bacterium]